MEFVVSISPVPAVGAEALWLRIIGGYKLDLMPEEL